MDFLSIFLIAVSLAMDALAAALSTGMCVGKTCWRDAARIGLYFGGFQFAMTLAGWLLGCSVSSFIGQVDHWIAFGLLLFIGGKMIYEAVRSRLRDEICDFDPMARKRLLMLAVATSIDALAMGISFALIQLRVFTAALTIGAVTFVLSAAGYLAGKRLNGLFRKYAEIAGGVLLIAIGIRILIEHLTGG